MNKKFVLLIIVLVNIFLTASVMQPKTCKIDNFQSSYIVEEINLNLDNNNYNIQKIIVNIPLRQVYKTNFIEKSQNIFLFNQQIQKLLFGNILNYQYDLQLFSRIAPYYQLDEAYTLNWYYHNNKQIFFNSNGLYGRFYIPDVNIDVALTYVDSSNWYQAQEIVDKIDSAAYLAYGDSCAIADHNIQGFSSIIKCKIGTKAFIKHDTYTEVYECIELSTGINARSDVYNNKGQSIYSYSSDILSLYTCRENSRDIYLVKFRKIDTLKYGDHFSLALKWIDPIN